VKQEFSADEENLHNKITIRETNSFKGIPFADSFKVKVDWVIQNIIINNTDCCNVSITMDVDFIKKIPFFQSKIVSDTKIEMIEVFNNWQQFARKFINIKRNNVI
jgi:hypothetical protein